MDDQTLQTAEDTTGARRARAQKALSAGDGGVQFGVDEGFQCYALLGRQRGTTGEQFLHTVVLRCREVRIRPQPLKG